MERVKILWVVLVLLIGSSDLTSQTVHPFLRTNTTEVLVTKALDLYGTLRSDVVYTIVGAIDLDTVEIVVPTSGLVIKGSDYFVSGLFSTLADHAMFKNATGSYAGNLKIQNLFITSSGANSKVFDLDNQENNGAVELGGVNLGDFSAATTSLGELSNYRQFRTDDCGFFRNQDGLTFSGTWSGGFRINDVIVLAQAANSTLFKPSPGLTFAGRCISDINAASVDPTTITFDFVPENFLQSGGFQLTGAAFAPNSSISVTTDETAVQAYFRDCVEIRNTRPGFEMTWTTDVVTPLTEDIPAKALGATTTTNNTWFTQTADNEITYNSNLVSDLNIFAPIVVDGGGNDELRVHIRRWDESESAYETVITQVRQVNNLVGGLDVANFIIVGRVDDMSMDDRLDLQVENASDGTDVSVTIGSQVIGIVL